MDEITLEEIVAELKRTTDTALQAAANFEILAAHFHPPLIGFERDAADLRRRVDIFAVVYRDYAARLGLM